MTTPPILQPGSYTLAPGTTITLSTPALVPPAPAPTPVVTATDPTAMPLGNLPGWRQIFTDDFTTPAATGTFPTAYPQWFAYPSPWKDTSGHGVYTPLKVLSAHDSYLDIRLHTENGIHLVGALTPTLPVVAQRKGQRYGRYSVRYKCDPTLGFKFIPNLLWPDSEQSPPDGEIDWTEADLTGKISGFVHYQNAASTSDQDAYSSSVPQAGAWHVATVEWLPNSVQFFLDGALVHTCTTRIPNTPMHSVLQAETALSGIVPLDTAVAHVLVDWVAIWAADPSVQ